MALTSVFYDGVVTETDRAKNRSGAPDYGVYGISDFEVKPHPSIPYAVLVTKGKAHGWGVTDEATEDQVVQCGPISSGTRYDLIADRRNWQPAAGGPSTLVAIPGGATAEIPAGRKIGPGVEDDQPLALVEWKGGLSAPNRIIDLRVWASNGGLYAKDDLVRTYLTGIGTEVNINGVNWVLRLGANNMLEWMTTGQDKMLHRSGLTGSAGGKTNGEWTLTFPPFPNGVTGLQLTDATNSLVDVVIPKVVTLSNGSARIRSYFGSNGSGPRPHADNFYFHATGW